MAINYEKILAFYKNKTVLVTGHTGFKGAWLCKILVMAGAKVVGYALESPTTPSLFNLLGLGKQMMSIIGDIREYDKLIDVIGEYKPEIVIHLAAQPLVRLSYKEPRYTYETNVMGTVNVCDAVKNSGCVKSFLNVTTDKVYENKEWCYGYRENESLNGYDPYSNSKSCSELVTQSYINSFFKDMGISVSTARAGNVIGGGDFALDRIIPDCVRAAQNRESIIIRNPYSVRPYQHVMEPLMMYLTIMAEQEQDKSKSGFYNIGPDEIDCVSTEVLVGLFVKYYGEGFAKKVNSEERGLHEANFLKLDTSLVKSLFGYHPRWHIEEAVDKVVEWTKAWESDCSEENMNKIIEKQIYDFINVQF